MKRLSIFVGIILTIGFNISSLANNAPDSCKAFAGVWEGVLIEDGERSYVHSQNYLSGTKAVMVFSFPIGVYSGQCQQGIINLTSPYKGGKLLGSISDNAIKLKTPDLKVKVELKRVYPLNK